MKVIDFLHHEAVVLDIKATDKESAIREMAEVLKQLKKIKDTSEVIDVLLQREKLGSTGIGQGIGIPHAKSQNVKSLVAAFGLSQKGVNFDSLDGEPVYIFFLLIAPADSAGPHLKALARVSRLLKDKFFRECLKNTKTAKDIMDLVSQEDARIGG